MGATPAYFLTYTIFSRSLASCDFMGCAFEHDMTWIYVRKPTDAGLALALLLTIELISWIRLPEVEQRTPMNAEQLYIINLSELVVQQGEPNARISKLPGTFEYWHVIYRPPAKTGVINDKSAKTHCSATAKWREALRQSFRAAKVECSAKTIGVCTTGKLLRL